MSLVGTALHHHTNRTDQIVFMVAELIGYFGACVNLILGSFPYVVCGDFHLHMCMYHLQKFTNKMLVSN